MRLTHLPRVPAAIGLVLFFVGAIVTAIRVHCYSHIPYPLRCSALGAGSLALRLALL